MNDTTLLSVPGLTQEREVEMYAQFLCAAIQVVELRPEIAARVRDAERWEEEMATEAGLLAMAMLDNVREWYAR